MTNTNIAATQGENSESAQIADIARKIKGISLYVQESTIPGIELLSLYILGREAGEMKKSIDALIYTRLKSGEKVKSLSLVAPVTKREIKDPCAAFAAVKEFVPSTDFISCCNVGFAKLLKTFQANYRTDDGRILTKEEAEKLLLEYLEDIVLFKTDKEKVTYKPEL